MALIAWLIPNDRPKETTMSDQQVQQTWTTEELQRDFEVHGFSAPYVVVTRKSDWVKGSLEFTHSPRVYFNFRRDV
jgi:hypothetical protein